MNIGVIFILTFVGAVALRDVFFGGFFQQYDFYQVVLVAFALTTVVFGAVVVARRDQMRALMDAWRETIIVNLGTAAAWFCYLTALKLLEPAVVNAIHTGMGAITLMIMGQFGINIARPARITRLELGLWAGVLLTLVALSSVAVSGHSGLADRSLMENLAGLALAFVSGIFMAPTSETGKRMNEKGVHPASVLAVRQVALMLIAAVIVASGESTGTSITAPGTLVLVSVASLLLIALPLYVLQHGLARTSALSIWVIQPLGPCLIFAAQLMDGRLHPSAWTLACLTSFSMLAIAANLARKFERATA